MIAQKRVALYARVSTVEKGQDPETQLMALRAYVEHRGFRCVEEYIDYASGTREDRPQYRRLLQAARHRQLDVVLVWRYDRFARSTQALVQALKEFHSLGVDFISYQEHIDTTTPQGEMIFTVMASLAQFESALISERVKAGRRPSKSWGSRCLGLFLQLELWIPALEHRPEFLIQRFHPRLQEQMCAAFGPLHLLTLAEALADHLVDGRFHKAGADALAITVALPIIGNEGNVIKLSSNPILINALFASQRGSGGRE